MEQGTANFADADAATRSPLARGSSFDGVTQVFLGADFVTVSKADETSWSELKPAVLGALVEHFTAGGPSC